MRPKSFQFKNLTGYDCRTGDLSAACPCFLFNRLYAATIDNIVADYFSDDLIAQLMISHFFFVFFT